MYLALNLLKLNLISIITENIIIFTRDVHNSLFTKFLLGGYGTKTLIICFIIIVASI